MQAGRKKNTRQETGDRTLAEKEGREKTFPNDAAKVRTGNKP